MIQVALELLCFYDKGVVIGESCILVRIKELCVILQKRCQIVDLVRILSIVIAAHKLTFGFLNE